ncbi:hypothetical protein F511_46687 [Dorcoceras hygrometricum]|uniref:Uncharacterized protein n=1 Tax=Dorcoceras hygrometricum TaxID=472368 RepID=A0A2Z6ZZS1_9LAMI|nr:hypothetical protein F511_46687 [Dorcoceras hygrometricum]
MHAGRAWWPTVASIRALRCALAAHGGRKLGVAFAHGRVMKGRQAARRAPRLAQYVAPQSGASRAMRRAQHGGGGRRRAAVVRCVSRHRCDG